jgi:hypothetical protein
MTEAFDYHRLLDLLSQASVDLAAIPYRPFVAALSEFAKAFAYFGLALNFAFADIAEKASIIVANFQDVGKFHDLQSMIRDEISKGIERENSKEYISTARSLLRLLWFLDFLLKVLELVFADSDAHLATLVRHAYELTLAPHHSLALRTAARIAIRYVPDTDAFVSQMLGEGKTWDQYKAQLTQLITRVSPLRESLWGFYHDNSLETLP